MPNHTHSLKFLEKRVHRILSLNEVRKKENKDLQRENSLFLIENILPKILDYMEENRTNKFLYLQAPDNLKKEADKFYGAITKEHSEYLKKVGIVLDMFSPSAGSFKGKVITNIILNETIEVDS